jgi:ribosome-associated toxin RatA of RatAB toxin-antitoxin module
MTIVISSIKPITEVVLENGKIKRLTKKFKYEKKTPESDIRFQLQFETASMLWNTAW